MLYEHPDVYDALFPPEGFVEHYAALAERHPGPVLELACGTGQLTVPLAQRGRRVVGLDTSRPMLEAAERRAAAALAAVEFVEGDMRGFDLGVTCGLIFVARNSLLHLSAPAEFAEALGAVRRHLAPGGVFAFDVFNPDVRLLARAPGDRAFVMRVPSQRYGELAAEDTSDYDAATQVNRATWYISTPDHPDRWVAPLHLRSIFPQELPLLLAASGFRLVSRWGDLRGSPFASTSPRQVCVCAVGTPT
jgi:SAM-dependent methyltransferase